MRHTRFNHVYRAAGIGDCTVNGITARFVMLNVIYDVPYLMTEFDGKEYFDRPDEEKVLEYIKKNNLDPERCVLLCDKRNNPIYTPYLKPLDSVYKKEGYMGPCSGGNYVEFKHDTQTELIRVHDRYDTESNWDGLSR